MKQCKSIIISAIGVRPSVYDPQRHLIYNVEYLYQYLFEKSFETEAAMILYYIWVSSNSLSFSFVSLKL